MILIDSYELLRWFKNNFDSDKFELNLKWLKKEIENSIFTKKNLKDKFYYFFLEIIYDINKAINEYENPEDAIVV